MGFLVGEWLQLYLLSKCGDVLTGWWHACAIWVCQVRPIRMPCTMRRIEGVSWCLRRMLGYGCSPFCEGEEELQILLIYQCCLHKGGLEMVGVV